MSSTAPSQLPAALQEHRAAAGLARLLWGWLVAARKQRQRAEMPWSSSGQKNRGSCREMGPCTPSSALPPMQRSGAWGGHCHRDGFCPSRGRMRKPSELTRGHPQEQQRRIVLQGSHGRTSQDRSIPNADETPRIKAPLEAASFCSQEQPASGWEAAGPRGSPHKQGTDGRGWVRDGNGAGGSSGTAQSPEARQHRAAGGARGACLGTGEAVWDPLFHC